MREECSRSSLTRKRFSHQGKRGALRTYSNRKVLKGIEGPSLENRKSIDGSHSRGNEKNREPKRLPMGCSGSQRGLKERKRELFAGGGPAAGRTLFSLAEAPATGRNPFLLAEVPATGRNPFPLAEAPAAGRNPFSLAEAPAAGRNPFPLTETPFRWRSVRATGVGSTAQINAQACNSEKRCDSLQITFLLKDNYAKIKYQNIKDGHKTNEQLFYIRSAYHRTAA